MAFGLGALAPLAGLQKGWMQGDEFNQRLRENQILQQMRQMELQQQQQAQRAQADVFGVARSGGLQGLFQPPQIPPMPTGQQQQMPQPPQPLSPSMAAGAGQPSSPLSQNLLMPNLVGRNVNWQSESPQLQSRVSDMLGAMPTDLRSGAAVESGYRTNQQQADIYQRSGQGTKFMAAPPGKSLHETGQAADWAFSDPNADQWMHENAPRFDLDFPLGNRDPNHMQLAQAVVTGQTGVPGAAFVKQGAPGPIVSASAGIGAAAIKNLPQQQYGGLDLKALTAAIDKVDPDAPDAVKAIALGQIIKLAAPQERMAYQAIMLQNRQQFSFELAQFKSQMAEQNMLAGIAGRGAQAQDKGFQLLQTPEGIRSVNPNTGEVKDIPGLAAGTTKLGGAQSTMLSQPEIKFPEKWEGMPDKPPPDSGIRSDIWTGALQYVQTGKMPTLGMSAGPRTQILAATPAALQALGMKASDAPVAQAEYHGMLAAESTLGRRLANLTTSIDEAQRAAPAVTQTSAAVPRTDIPPINEFNQWLQESTGDPNIVRFKAALNTYLNIYAKGINPTGQMTDQQQRHAYETLRTAMSKGQIQAGVDQLNKELGYAKEGLGQAAGELPSMFPHTAMGQRQGAGATTDWSKMTDEELLQRARETGQ